MSETIESMDTSDFDSAEWPGESNETYQEYSEAWGEARRRPAPVRTAPRQTAYTPRPSGPSGYVTQAQLQAALARVNAQMTTNSNAIRTIDGRVRSVIAEQGRQTTALKREIADRKKEAESLRRDLQFTRELSAVIPLIAGSTNSRFGQILPLAHLLPSDFLGGSGGTPGSGSSSLGGNNLVALGVIAATLLR